MAVMLKDLPAFEKGFSIVKVDSLVYDGTWKPVWGEVASIRNHYKELARLRQKP